ncbi:uncharacterized protein LOC117067026 isoform X3 [Trachypithecus francoisi]|uniref:uncharacterized protein LOC117067026 isoform X3 n=1 Tax=Trachypithecus francoisi TaxID=54180 RepID=UPI00141B9A43|nr:uncharacterized protein LOC117067026 isoform X3 [Trachypithecus francoisi]
MQERTSDPCYLLVTPRGSFFSLLVALQNVKWHKNSGWGPQRDWLTTGEAVVMAHLFSPVACPQDPWESRVLENREDKVFFKQPTFCGCGIFPLLSAYVYEIIKN